MQPYFYKIREISSGRYYVRCQYGKSSNPNNLFKTYFTSNSYIKSKVSTEFVIEKIVVRSDARNYEKRYLKKCYHLLGKDKFLKLMINRNLSPGILHDDLGREKISQRMKIQWADGIMNNVHKKATETRKNRKYKKVTKSIEEKLKISERMKKNNPMFDDNVRKKHKQSINSEENKKRKSEIAKGNTYTKGRTWYNNGEESKMLYECPIGWIKGRLTPHWNYNRKKKNEQTAK